MPNSDYNLYTLKNKDYLNKHKTTDNNLINHTPFFILSSDINKEEINKTNTMIKNKILLNDAVSKTNYFNSEK